jgi:hypothetical protein
MGVPGPHISRGLLTENKFDLPKTDLTPMDDGTRIQRSNGNNFANDITPVRSDPRTYNVAVDAP